VNDIFYDFLTKRSNNEICNPQVTVVIAIALRTDLFSISAYFISHRSSWCTQLLYKT